MHVSRGRTFLFACVSVFMLVLVRARVLECIRACACGNACVCACGCVCVRVFVFASVGAHVCVHLGCTRAAAHARVALVPAGMHVPVWLPVRARPTQPRPTHV